jgi:DNA repair protein RecO
MIVSFLNDHGERLVGFAKSAQKPSSKWVANFEPLSLVNLSLFGKEQSEIQRVTRCDLLHSPLILGHLESNLVIGCLADIFDRTAKVGVEDPRLFRLLSACTYALKSQPDHAMAILAYCEHWMLHCLGLLPHPRLCGYCGDDVEPLIQFTEEYGWRCNACTVVSPQIAFPEGIREYLRLLRTSSATEAPNPNTNKASRTITSLLRKRLQLELGNTQSYIVMNQVLSNFII